jgi:hypothetical protein
MLNMVEKQSRFIGTYYCVYLGNWLVLQTKNSKLAHLCARGNPPVGLLDIKQLVETAQLQKEKETAA